MNTTGIVLSLTDEQLKDIDEYCEMTQHIESGEQACVSLYELRGLLEELRRLRAENAELAKDAGRLDLLDSLCESYGFQDVHEGNRWVIDGPYRDIRTAADSLEAQ